ncbi:mCG144827, partial [Mus musculus]
TRSHDRPGRTPQTKIFCGKTLLLTSSGAGVQEAREQEAREQEAREREKRNPVPLKEHSPSPRTCHSLIGCSPSAELTSRGRQSTSSHKIPLAHAQIICLPLRTQLSAPSCNGECGRGSQHIQSKGASLLSAITPVLICSPPSLSPPLHQVPFFFHTVSPLQSITLPPPFLESSFLFFPFSQPANTHV